MPIGGSAGVWDVQWVRRTELSGASDDQQVRLQRQARWRCDSRVTLPTSFGREGAASRGVRAAATQAAVDKVVNCSSQNCLPTPTSPLSPEGQRQARKPPRRARGSAGRTS